MEKKNINTSPKRFDFFLDQKDTKIILPNPTYNLLWIEISKTPLHRRHLIF